MKRTDLVSVVEAAYFDTPDDRVWLGGLLDAIRPAIDVGLGASAYTYDLSAPSIRVDNMIERDARISSTEAMRALGSVSANYVDQSWRTLPCAMASEVPGFDSEPAVKEVFEPAGVGDILAINAFDPSGAGVWVGSFRARKSSLSLAKRTLYSRIAAHVAAGFRLRCRTRAALPTPTEAVLTPHGRVVHAEDEARLDGAREALTEATRAIEKARGALRLREPEEAIVRWRALVHSRWTLIDRFERDGTHYVVAKTNEPKTPPESRLSIRERQVLTYAALGHHNKLIGYELGLATSTVRVLIARAARKLGVKTREAAIEKFAASR